jgi:transposase
MEETAITQAKTLKEANAEIAKLTRERDLYKRLAEQLETENRLKNKRLYGTSSEKTDTEQLLLFNEAESLADTSVPAPEVETITYHRRKQKGKREADLSKLEHVRIDYELSTKERICPECGDSLCDMGSDIRSELTIVPAQIYVTEHAAHKYVCRNCDSYNTSTPIIKAPCPKPFLEKSLASPSLIAHIIADKYTRALPLYRQEADWKTKGISIARRNMANWILKTAEKVAPIYEQMKCDLLALEILHADETTMQVLKEPGKKAAAKSYMWLYRSGGDATHPLILYEWRKSRSALCAQEFLGDWSGYLHADGYDAYHKLENPTVVGCMAHVRRKFDEALKILPKEAQVESVAFQGLTYCNALFSLEQEWKDLDCKKRYELRQKKSKPIFDEFIGWAQNAGVLPASPPGKAIHYLLSQKTYLENVYLDGRLELSNNRAERSIKPFVIGRKNWLFANSVRGAKSSAILYSIVESAKENKLKVFEYLTYLFEQLPNTSPQRISALGPHSNQLPKELYVTD